MLHPEEPPRRSYVAEQLEGHNGPVIAASDYVKTFAEQIRPFVGTRQFHALGTDGFGRSDTRKQLRSFFEVDRRWIALAALTALARDERRRRAREGRAKRSRNTGSIPPSPSRRPFNMANIELTVPDLGGFNDIPVIEVLVHPGDTVEKDDPLVTLESDKATMEVPAASAGVVREIKVKIGDKVSQGSVLVTVEPSAPEQAEAPALRQAQDDGGLKQAGAAPDAEKPRDATSPNVTLELVEGRASRRTGSRLCRPRRLRPPTAARRPRRYMLRRRFGGSRASSGPT